VQPNPQGATRRRTVRKSLVAASVAIPIAILHFFTGSHYKGPYPEFVNGYLLDILVPFAFYFLLSPQEATISPLRHGSVKGILVFGVGSCVEIAQFFGIPIFGRTFDPVDFVMYGIGVLLAALLDTTLFPRIFKFWTPEARSST